MSDLISRQAAIDALDKCHCGGTDENGSPWIYKENAVEAIEMVEPSPPAQPDIIYCGECIKMKVDSVFHDCWCSETGKKVWINHYCGYAERREVTT